VGWGLAKTGHPYPFSLARIERPNRSFFSSQARASLELSSSHCPVLLPACRSSRPHMGRSSSDAATQGRGPPGVAAQGRGLAGHAGGPGSPDAATLGRELAGHAGDGARRTQLRWGGSSPAAQGTTLADRYRAGEGVRQPRRGRGSPGAATHGRVLVGRRWAS
jgi:hypothetical protein